MGGTAWSLVRFAMQHVDCARIWLQSWPPVGRHTFHKIFPSLRFRIIQMLFWVFVSLQQQLNCEYPLSFTQRCQLWIYYAYCLSIMQIRFLISYLYQHWTISTFECEKLSMWNGKIIGRRERKRRKSRRKNKTKQSETIKWNNTNDKTKQTMTKVRQIKTIQQN